MFGRLKFSKPMLILSGLGTATGLAVIFKESIGGDDYEGDEKLTGKTAIVTGANSGLGKQLSKELANRGGRVIMACRDLDKCEAVRKEIMEVTFNKNVQCKKIDMSSLKSIRDFADDINKNESRLDVLVNNAGVMAPPFTLTEDGFETQLCVNYLGPFLLTNLLLDKLTTCKPSRIVNVTSLAHHSGEINFKDLNGANYYDAKKAYSQSKLALLLFNMELAKKLEGTGVSTYAVHPGLVKTEIGRHMGMNKSMFSRYILGPVWWFFMLTPRQGVQTMMHCILSPEVENVSGQYWVGCEQRLPSEDATDAAAARRLWLISERWTRLDS